MPPVHAMVRSSAWTGWGGDGRAAQLDVGGDVQRLDVGQLPDPVPRAPGEEAADGQLATRLGRLVLRHLGSFLSSLETDIGIKPILYTFSAFATQYLDQEMHDYPLWIASYGKSAPTLPAGWKDYLIWQLADGVTDDPVLAGFDINVFKGSTEEFVALARRKN